MQKMKLALVVALLSGTNAIAASNSDIDMALAGYGQAENLPKSETTKDSKSAIDVEVDKYLDNEGDNKLYREDVKVGKGDKKANAALMRAPSIKSTGLAFGAQAGLHWRYKQLNELIETKYRGKLDQINFRPFIVDGKILTPSIRVMKDTEDYQSPQRVVETKVSFIVEEEARIVSIPPTYRNYLIRYYDKPKPIHSELQPATTDEEFLMKKSVREGFEIGIKTANQIFLDGLLKMERDIEGRVNYRKMVQLKMISPAALKITERNVTFNGRTMNVGERITEITSNSQFKTMDEWQSVWINAEKGAFNKFSPSM